MPSSPGIEKRKMHEQVQKKKRKSASKYESQFMVSILNPSYLLSPNHKDIFKNKKIKELYLDTIEKE